MNSELLSEAVQERGNLFSLRGLRIWLHECGFDYGEIGKKGVYFDGHERDDVKLYRKEYIKRQRLKHHQYLRFDEELLDDPSYWMSNPNPYWNIPRGASGLESRPILKVSHDESIYRLFGYISKQWFEHNRPAILPKGDGRGFHVSDFITTFGPVKNVYGKAVRMTLGPVGNGCYWNSELFLAQVEEAVLGLHKQFPEFRFDFKFDNAPLHKKFAEDAPVLEKMNKNPGGKQPRMRETVWEHNGSPIKQNLVFSRLRKINGMYFNRGEPKGLLQVAKERFLRGAKIRKVESMNKVELIKELKKFPDFKNVKNKLFELMDKLNQKLFNGEPRIMVEFLPKYHCELAEIELWWRNSKYTFRKENDRQWRTIEKRVNKALDQFKIPYYAKLFRQVKAIEYAYADGLGTNEILHLKETNFLKLVKMLSAKRKSHRGPASLQIEKSWNFLTMNERTPREYL